MRKFNKYFKAIANDEQINEPPKENINNTISIDFQKSDEEEFINIKRELLTMRNPKELIIEKWKKTSLLRIAELSTNSEANMSNILKEWPLYKNAYISDLVHFIIYIKSIF